MAITSGVLVESPPYSADVEEKDDNYFTVSPSAIAGQLVTDGGAVSILDGGVATDLTIGVSGFESLWGLLYQTPLTEIGSFSAGGSLVFDPSGTGLDTNAVIESGGVQEVYAGGLSVSAMIEFGGTQLVDPGYDADFSGTQPVASAFSTTIGSGGQQILFSGLATDATVNNGGAEVLLGGEADGTTINSGGLQEVYGGVVSGTVFDSGTQEVFSGATVSGVTVANGDQYISAGGAAVSETISTDGHETVWGSDTNAIVLDGGQLISSGGVAIGAQVSSGTQQVYSGGVASGAQIVSAGEQVIWAGGSAVSAVVSGIAPFGVEQDVSGTATNTIVEFGGVLTVASGGLALDPTISSGGVIELTSGGTATGISLLSGGLQMVFSGAAVSGVALNGATQLLLSGALATATDVGSGGVETVFALDSGATVQAGGFLEIQSGGTAVSPSIASGGFAIVEPGGIESGAVVNSGGHNEVLSGGSAVGASVAGVEEVLFGGTDLDPSVSSGGAGFIFGSATAITVDGGGALTIEGGGVASGIDVSSGGTLYVSSGGSVSGVTIESGGFEYVESGATTSDVIVYGSATDENDGDDVDDTVNSGGEIIVDSTGDDSGSTIETSGAVVVQSGGSAGALTIDSGATVSFTNGATAAGSSPTTVVGGGIAFFYGNANAGSATFNNSGTGPQIVTTNSFGLGPITVDTYLKNNLGGMIFQDASNAGSATVNNFAGGVTFFEDQSNAGHALIINTGSAAGQGGVTAFVDSADAGSATILTGPVGVLGFGDSATANSATISINASDTGGGLGLFVGSSTAANSKITINGAATGSGGFLMFAESSDAGSAQIVNNSQIDTTASRAASALLSAYLSNSTHTEQDNENFSTSMSRIANAYPGQAIVPIAGLAFIDNSTPGSANITTDSGGITWFADSAGGDHATVSNTGAAITLFVDTAAEAQIVNSSGGATMFLGSAAVGGSATFANNGGATVFGSASDAEHAVIINSGGATLFDNATAGSATISNVFGATLFYAQSGSGGAGSATITNGIGGETFFAGYADGNQATINNTDPTAIVDFSFAGGPAANGQVSLGSIAGGGTYFLGTDQLTVGGNNSSTVVSGTITSGGVMFVSGATFTTGPSATLVKTGSGTLALDGTVNAVNLVAGGGTLAVSGGITGSSSATIGIFGGGAATLELGSGASAENVKFGLPAGTATLVLDDPGDYTGQITGFSTADLLDLRGTGYAAGGSATLANGQLQVVENGHTYRLALGITDVENAFILTADGHGGVMISGSSATLTVGQGQTITNQAANAGTYINVTAGGMANGTTVNNGGTQNVTAGGVANGTTVNDGGVQTVGAGGVANGTTLNDPGLQIVSSGGSASSTLISGGVQMVESGGTAVADTVLSGGTDTILGSDTGARIGSGGTELVSAGGVASNALIQSGGTATIGSGGTDVSASIAGGGRETVLADGTASNATVSAGGRLILNSGSSLSATVLASGTNSGVLTVTAGLAQGTTVDKGAKIVVSGGLESATVVASGGIDFVSSGGVASGVSVVAGGVEDVIAGGTTVSSLLTGVGSTSGVETLGGVFNSVATAGGTASATIVSAGGKLVVSSGGAAVSGSVNSGGIAFVGAAGTTTNVLVAAGGNENVAAGGTTTGTTVSGAGAVENLGGNFGSGSLGGTASGTVVSAAGGLIVSSGGIASGGTATGGGHIAVFAGGSAVSTVLGLGGNEVVSSGGVASATTISGGVLDIAPGGDAEDGVSFAGGGTYEIDGPTLPGATIFGFGAGDTIDLRGIAFDSTGSATLGAGNLLTVSEGGQAYTLQFDPSQGGLAFALGSDGMSGTLVNGAAPSISESLFADTGSSANDLVTSDPEVTGTAAPNGIVTISEGATALGSATADPTGAWNFTPVGLADGTHSLVAEEANPFGSGTATLTFTLDTTPPAVTETLVDPGSSGVTSTSDLIGTGDPNALVTIENGGTVLGTTTADGTGAWSFDPTLANGSYTLVASETDAAGNTGSASVGFTLETGPVPVVTAMLAHDTGVSATDGDTANPALKGLADPNALVTISDGATVLGTTTATASGHWVFKTVGLADGVYTLTASETNSAGNTGAASVSFALDTTQPAVTLALVDDTGSSPSDGITQDPAVTGGGDPFATVTISKGTTVLGTTTADASGLWSYTPVGLADGTITLKATETDAAGNRGSATLAFTLDTTPPPIAFQLAHDTGASASDGVTSNPALKGTGVGNAVVTISEGNTILGTTTASAGGAWSFTPVLADGQHTLTATESDLAGNTGSSTLGFTLETTAPVVTVALADDTGASASDDVTADPTLSGTGEAGAAVTIKQGGTVLGTTVADGSGDWVFDPAGLAAGKHTVLASETDLAGNTGTATLAFTLETAPAVTVGLAHDTGSSASDGITANPALKGAGDANATVTISDQFGLVGTTVAGNGGNWNFTPTGLADGIYAITASETDPAGLIGTATFGFTLDTTPPAVTETLADDTGASPADGITSDPTLAGTGDPNAVVTLSEGKTILGTTVADGGGNWSFDPVGLAAGKNTVVASETDAAGNTGKASLVFTLQTAPAVTETLAVPPGSGGTTASPALAGTGDGGATVTISEGGTLLGITTAAGNGNWNFTPSLADGTHMLTASETDVSGLTGTASLSFMLATGGAGANTAVDDADTVYGAADMVVAGGKGATIIAGAGDTVQAGASDLIDLTHLSAGGGALFQEMGKVVNDTIVGFAEAVDHLRFVKETAANEAQIIATAATSGGNTILALPDKSTITLVGVGHVDLGIFS